MTACKCYTRSPTLVTNVDFAGAVLLLSLASPYQQSFYRSTYAYHSVMRTTQHLFFIPTIDISDISNK